jgi:hypothetical protein
VVQVTGLTTMGPWGYGVREGGRKGEREGEREREREKGREEIVSGGGRKEGGEEVVLGGGRRGEESRFSGMDERKVRGMKWCENK